jgi:hypothetical protein
MQEVITSVAAAIAILTLIGLIHRMFLNKIIHEIKDGLAWLRKFQRDWDGEAAEPGRDAIPGVMERLNCIDGELQRNGGHSLKDKVVATWELVDNLDSRVTVIEIRQCEIQESLKTG